jgi:hypothetical protein
VNTATIRSRSVSAYDRLDAHYFTSPGVAAAERVATLEASGSNTTRVGDLAKVWDPPRFARAYAAVAEEGIAYLRPYDVFDYIPMEADRLSTARNDDWDRLIPATGTILQTCSGRNLGPVTIADDALASFALSHDMIRIEVADEEMRHYLLAFLKTPTGQALLRRSKSGSVIDHITTSDVAAVPVLLVPDDLRKMISDQMREATLASANARGKLMSLLASMEEVLPTPKRIEPMYKGWSLRTPDLMDRLDSAFYDPRVRAAREQVVNSGGTRCGELAEASLPVRYKRYYVNSEHGRPILSGRQLLQVEPVNLRYVSDRSFKDPTQYELSAGMTVFGAVGRSEGRQGTPALIAAGRHGWLASNDVMRLRPRPGVNPGAVWLAIAAHQSRLQINALSFGSVIDHMNPWDVEDVIVPVVSDAVAQEAEAAWSVFSAASTNVSAAVATLEAALRQ